MTNLGSIGERVFQIDVALAICQHLPHPFPRVVQLITHVPQQNSEGLIRWNVFPELYITIQPQVNIYICFCN